MELYPYKSGEGQMEPVALQNHLVAIHYVKDTFYRRVNFYEAITPTQVINLGALAAGATSPRTNVTGIDTYDQEFGQFRWFCLDNAQIRVFIPRGAAKGDMKTIQAVLDPSIVFRNPSLSLTEFFVWQDNRPAIEAVNGGAVALAAVRMVAMGFRYHTDDLSSGPLTAQEISAYDTLKKDPAAAAKSPAEIMAIAIEQARVPCTHVWCSGMGAGR